MSLDRRKGLQAAERLLKSGKPQAALAELQRVSQSAPHDLLTLNRLGDLLARQGRAAEAIGYYAKIADQFAESGFFPKATAIHKKILRLDPKNLDSMVKLGELYLAQNLHGEARNYLLHAANQFLEAKQYDRARHAYQILVKAQPDDPRNHVRLAETRAAAGDRPGAVADLMTIGDALLGGGKQGEAEKIFRTARELDKTADGPLLGLIRSLCAQERNDEGLTLLEDAARKPAATPSLVGELALRYELAGRRDEAVCLLEATRVFEIPATTWVEIVRSCAARGKADLLWERIDPVLRAQVPADDPEPLVALLEELSEVEPEGHVPALQRLVDVHGQRGDVQGTIRALEWLVRAYQTRSMHDEASLALERLREIAPSSALFVSDHRADASDAHVSSGEERPGVDAGLGTGTGAGTGVETEAPAVPLNRPEEEFVAGRMTQAEILEKYGLLPQAMEQLEEIVSRFPGHVAAQERLASMLRASGDKTRLSEVLVQLAVALRTAGKTAQARQAASEAAATHPLEPAQIQALEEIGFFEERGTPARPVSTGPRDEVDLTLDFDEGESAQSDQQAAVGVRPERIPKKKRSSRAKVVERPQMISRPTRQPGLDMLEEIRQIHEGGDQEEARRRIGALYLLGYAGPELEALRGEVENAPRVAASEPGARTVGEEPSVESHETLLPADFLEEDDDLNAITAALESELFAVERAPLVPAAESEQSLEDILQTFRERVHQEVDSDDHRTHYDLGIAYKEMGLTEEAIQEFQVAARSTEFHRDACSMIALCHRDRSEMAEAARWYRQALDSPGEGDAALSGLRYDLAEVLLLAGDTAGALGHFREVLEVDPTYRDVRGRVSELENRR